MEDSNWRAVKRRVEHLRSENPIQLGVTPADEVGQRELTFANLLATGTTLIHAYRQAFDCSDLGVSEIIKLSTELAGRPDIAAHVEKTIQIHDQEALTDPVFIRNFVTYRLKREAETAKMDGARIRALELLGKLDFVGMFKDRVENTVKIERTPENIEHEIRQRLRKLMSPK
jgi:hypothetical protein